jgi:hypothetical protein
MKITEFGYLYRTNYQISLQDLKFEGSDKEFGRCNSVV